MKRTPNDLQKNLHDISNALHNAYETLENIELTMADDPEFCRKAIRATKNERDRAFSCIANLKQSLREMAAHE